MARCAKVDDLDLASATSAQDPEAMSEELESDFEQSQSTSVDGEAGVDLEDSDAISISSVDTVPRPLKRSRTTCYDGLPGKVRDLKLIPRQFLNIVLMLMYVQGPGILCQVDCVELFAGCHSITNGMRGLDYSAVSLDMATVSEHDDLNTSKGFLRAITYVLGMKPGGLLWAAPPCSSWVWLSRGSTGRSLENPMGQTSYGRVRAANEQGSRVLLLILLAVVLRNAVFIGEQPATTLLPHHQRWKTILEDKLQDSLIQFLMWMQPFGSHTPKRTWLVSNSERVQTLCKPLEKSERNVQTTRTVTRANGSTYVEGTADLKSTQAYPAAFGRAVASTYSDIVSSGWQEVQVMPEDVGSIPCSNEVWEEANLNQVLKDLDALYQVRRQADA